MRIISGSHRGRKIFLPKDTKTIRPTSDFVREAMFNILTHGRFNDNQSLLPGAVVADICCGSGALGLEALSRGASYTTLVDNSREAAGVVKQNIEHFKEQSRAEFISADATKLPPAKKKHHLVLCDPPYHQGLIPKILTSLQASEWLADQAVIITESDSKDTYEIPANFELLDQRNYGRTTLEVLRFSFTD